MNATEIEFLKPFIIEHQLGKMKDDAGYYISL